MAAGNRTSLVGHGLRTSQSGTAYAPRCSRQGGAANPSIRLAYANSPNHLRPRNVEGLIEEAIHAFEGSHGVRRANKFPALTRWANICRAYGARGMQCTGWRLR